MFRRIPLQPYPDVTQQSELDGLTYSFRLRWCARSSVWHLDLATVDGDPIASGLVLCTGWPLLYRNLHAARPPGELFVVDLQGRDDNPTLEDLGTRFALMYEEAEDS